MTRDAAPLRGLDLNLLVTLRALLREGSVTRAAEQLGQTQPTVSRALSTLRAAFDDQLLVRSGRGMALTSLAQSLRIPLERTLAALDRLQAVGEFEPAQDERTFRVVMPDILGGLVIAPLVVRLGREAPNFTLQVFGAERDALRGLLEDDIDLVVGASPLDHQELYGRSVVPDGVGWSVVYGPKHPAWGSTMDQEVWLASDHVQLIPRGSPDDSPLDQLLMERGCRRVIRLQLAYLTALPHTLAETTCVTTLPTPIARLLADIGGLRCARHPLGDELPRVPIRMTWHEVHHAEPGHAWFRGVLGEVLAEHFSDAP